MFWGNTREDSFRKSVRFWGGNVGGKPQAIFIRVERMEMEMWAQKVFLGPISKKRITIREEREKGESPHPRQPYKKNM